MLFQKKLLIFIGKTCDVKNCYDISQFIHFKESLQPGFIFLWNDDFDIHFVTFHLINGKKIWLQTVYNAINISSDTFFFDADLNGNNGTCRTKWKEVVQWD